MASTQIECAPELGQNKPAEQSYTAALDDFHTKTTSMISVPLSDIEDVFSSSESFMPDVPPSDDQHGASVFPLPSDDEDSMPDEQIVHEEKDDTMPPETPRPALKRQQTKSLHKRGKSSLQEPDMAALLARLEMENNAIAKDPKSGIAAVGAHTGPGAAFEYRVRDTVCSTLSTINIPEEALGMSLGDFWALVTKDYAEALLKLPTMTPLMIHKGIPDFLRSAVWVGIAGAWDAALQVEFDSLLERLMHERPQNESIINKDLARCFPNHVMFKDADGEGQSMLGIILKAYSLYDEETGYCQGMAFVVGVLLMNMPMKDAFCTFVKLMESHNLRTSYSPSLSGLHSRTYQLKKLLGSISPQLLEHMTNLGVELAYLSQWFMTIFATNCPLHILFRIYDIIFAEGGEETIMRVALALIVTNEQRIMAMTELEEVLSLLLGRSLWDPYMSDPDYLIDEIARLSNVVTGEELHKLHEQFMTKAETGSGEKTVRSLGFSSGFRFLDGWWSGSPTTTKSAASSASTNNLLEMPGHAPKRSVSKRSVTTIDSSVGSGSGADSLLSNEGSASTAATEVERDAERGSTATFKSSRTARTAEDRSLHEQVEGLLLALSEVQREAAQTAAHLQEERERKENMSEIVYRLRDLVYQKDQAEEVIKKDRRQTMPSRVAYSQAESLIKDFNRKSILLNSVARSVSLNNLGQTTPDAELQDSLSRLCAILDGDEGTPASETGSYFEGQLGPNDRITRTKRRDSVRFQQRSRRPSERLARPGPSRNPSDMYIGSAATTPGVENPGCTAGAESLDYWPEATMFDYAQDSTSPITPLSEKPINPRHSSLQAREIIATAGDKPPNDEAILMELVNAKTREATAIHERDEMKVSLDKIRKQQDAQIAREKEWSGKLKELESMIKAQQDAHARAIAAQQEAHAAEMAKLKASAAKVRKASAVPTLEVRTERANSLWPSPAPSPGQDPSTPTKSGPSSEAPNSAGGSWWWQKKGRSVSTGNAAMS